MSASIRDRLIALALYRMASATPGADEAHPQSHSNTEISCIGPGMTVVGKISSEGTLSVMGRVEGDLHASIVRISDGAQVEGTIAAQELTIGGRFQGHHTGRPGRAA